MLTNQANISIINRNNLSVSPNVSNQHSPNKRGCCQTKRRNYSLITDSNGISRSNEKTCCSKEKQSDNSSEKASCSKCSSGITTYDKYSNKEKEFTLTDVNNAKREYDRLVSLGQIRNNDFLEIFDPNSITQVVGYTKEQVKAKLESTGLQLDVVSKVNNLNNSVNISIIDVGKNKKYLDQTFRFKSNETNIEKYEESIVIHTFARWIALQNNYKKKKPSKKSNKIQEQEPKKISRKDCKENYGFDSECMCINHDMGCTAEPIITLGGKLKLLFFCAGFFEVDVYECCFNHDVALWCSSGLEASALLGVSLITCFEEKIIDKYIEESSSLCAFFGLPLLMSLLVSWPIVLSPFIGIVMHFSTGSEYRNKDNSNSDSCLCGGDLPTVCCTGYDGACKDECCNKIDLCSHKVDKTRGEGCEDKSKCGKKCTYFVYPNAYNPEIKTISSYKLWSGKEEFYKDGDPTKILSKSDCCTVNLPDKCTDKCFNCFYACNLNPNGKGMSWNNGKILIDSSHLGAGMRGVPCCDGTPNEDLNSRYNYCQENYGKGGGGIPDCGSPVHKKTGGPCNEVDRVNKSNTNKLLLGNLG